MTNENLRERLFSLADEKYKNFHEKLTPNAGENIGVTIPVLRTIAKKIANGDYKSFLKAPYTKYHEELVVYGLVIGYIKADYDTVISYLNSFLPHINSWAVCDTTASNMKFLFNKNSELYFNYLQEKLLHKEIYVKRFAIVSLFKFIDDRGKIQEIAKIYSSIKSDEYYINMALAWGVCEILIKHYDVGIDILQSKKLNLFVHNKSIQKAKESFRLTTEQKNILLEFKHCD